MANTSSFAEGTKRKCRECGHIVTHRGWELHKTNMHPPAYSDRRFISYDVVVKVKGKWVLAR